MNNEQTNLIGKYFPKQWEDIKLPTSIRNILTNMQTQVGYRLMLYGSAGTGKTSSARIMVADDSKYQTLYLSGSNDFTIKVLREKVMQFVTGFSVNGKQKVVIIDECENIRDDIQDAFKILLDQTKTVNFIFITNEVEKVNSAVKSRCTMLEFDFAGSDLEEQKRNFLQFMLDVCKEENIQYTKDGMRLFMNQLYPDFRHGLVMLQQFKDAKLDLTDENFLAFSNNGKQNEKLYQLILDKQYDNSKLFYENASVFKGKERECFLSLGEPFFMYLNKQEQFELTLKCAIIVSNYSTQFVTSINKFVTLLSCLRELRMLVASSNQTTTKPK